MRNMDIGVGLPVVFVDHTGVEIAALVTRVHNADVLNLVVFPENGSPQHYGSVAHEKLGDTPLWRYCMEREEREANKRAEAHAVELARQQQAEDEKREAAPRPPHDSNAAQREADDVAHDDRKLADQLETAHAAARADQEESGDRSGLAMVENVGDVPQVHETLDDIRKEIDRPLTEAELNRPIEGTQGGPVEKTDTDLPIG